LTALRQSNTSFTNTPAKITPPRARVACWVLSFCSLETTVSGHGAFRQPATAFAGNNTLATQISSGAKAKQIVFLTATSPLRAYRIFLSVIRSGSGQIERIPE
jgi:hypothetical protein